MPENPLLTLVRVLSGVVLMQGRLGHQVLGQLLVMDSDDLAVAGATVAVTATTRQRNAVVQAAIRTAVPAVAAHFIIKKQLKRLETAQSAESAIAELKADNAALQRDKAALQGDCDRLSTELRAAKGAPLAKRRRSKAGGR